MNGISVASIELLNEKWEGCSMDDMTSYFEFCITERAGGLLEEHEYQEWADRINYYQEDGTSKAYRLKVVAKVCHSIYKNGFDFHYVPNVNEGYRVVSGRHRICIANALGVTHIPVLHTSDLADHLASTQEVWDFFFSPEGVEYKHSESHKLLMEKH